MANQLRMAMIQTILSLRAQRWSYRRIARTVGVHRETVARQVRLAESKPAKAPAGNEAEVDGSKPARAPPGTTATNKRRPPAPSAVNDPELAAGKACQA